MIKAKLFLIFLFLGFKVFSQIDLSLYDKVNPIEYAVPFLDMNVNTRLAGFGEVGVVSSIFYKNTGVYQNPALISKNSKNTGVDVYHMPWLRSLVDDINLYGCAGYFAIDSSNALAINFTYFDLGEITYTDEFGEYLSANNPNEFYFKLGYKYSFNKLISTGVALKYFRSDIVPSYYENAENINSIAFDIGFNYDNKYSLHNSSCLNTSAGLAITNFGPKVTYTDDSNKEFIPTKLSLGLFINPDINIMDICRINIELGYQAEKLLIPTSYSFDSTLNIIPNYDKDINIFEATYQSFSDAPGGFDEEINEIVHKFGSEFRFSYKDYVYVAFRHGRCFEHETKGNRKYQTFGYGIGAFGFMLDYMMMKTKNDSHLDNTWSITFGYTINLDKGFLRF